VVKEKEAFWHTFILSDVLSGIPSDILSGICSDILSDILPGISSDILSDSFLAYCVTFLAFYLANLLPRG